MKRWIILFLCLTFVAIYIQDYYYDPLDSINTEHLFGLNCDLNQTNKESLIDINFKGEILDIYKYEVRNIREAESIVADKEYLENYFSVHDMKFYNWNSYSIDSGFLNSICDPIRGTAPNNQLVIEFIEKLKNGYSCCLYYLFVLDKKTYNMYFLQCRL